MRYQPAFTHAFAMCIALLGFASPAQSQGTIAIVNARIETVGKLGTLEHGTLLIRDGKIETIGKDVDVPLAAQIIDATGKTLTPGIVDPYFTVVIGRNQQASATRTITIGGRTFILGGGSPAIATTFAKIADSLDASQVDWDVARRSGITTLHVVTGGYAQSLIAQPKGEEIAIQSADGLLLVTLSNETRSLDILRNGLKASGSRGGPPSGDAASRLAGLRGGRSGVASPTPPATTNSPPSGSTGGAQPSSPPNPTTVLWTTVREGKAPVFVNVNNAATILHTNAILKGEDKARMALVASGADVFYTLDSLDAKSTTLILAPRIDLRPNSRDRINIPRMLHDKKIEFAFSLSLGQSDFRAQQETPLFGVAMLVRSGLDRQLAWKALTLTPARLLGIDEEVGSLDTGKKANLILFDGDPFGASTGIDQIFIEGQPIHEE